MTTATTPTPTSTPPPRRRRPLLIVLILAGLVIVLVVVGAAILLRPPTQHPVPSLGAREAGYLTSSAILHERAAMATQGIEPYASAVSDLLRYADAALALDPEPQEPLEITGTEGPFVDDSAAAYGLALAYGVTGDDRYARQSARYIGAWVATTHTTIGTCRDSGGCQTSLIIGRTAPGFVFAADLLGGHAAFPEADRAALRAWLTAVILPTASILDNNWGDAGTFMRLVVTDYLGDAPGVLAALERWYVQADRIAADGSLPEETRRGASGMQYTQEALQYRIGAAVIAERFGLDLWSYRGAGGATLRDAIDYLASFWSQPERWPWDDGVEVPSTGPLWEIAYARFRDPAYVPIILDRRPFGEQGHSALRWTTLTDGIPLDATPSP